MSKYIFIFILILQVFWSHSVLCQSGFNKLMRIDDTSSNDIDGILYHDNKLILIGNAFNDSLGLGGQYIAACDTNGYIIWHNSFYNLGSHIISNSPNRLSISEKGEYIFPTYYFNYHNVGLFIVDSVGNQIYSRQYMNTERAIFPEIALTSFNSIYIFGWVQRNNYYYDNFIIKTDSTGNFIWIKYYGLDQFHEDMGDVVKNKDGTFTISSSIFTEEFDIAPDESWKKPWIFTIDTAGQIIDEWKGNQNDSMTLGGGPFYRIANGDYVIISRDFKLVNWNVFEYFGTNPTITKVDSNYEEKWKLNLANYTGHHDELVDLAYDSSRSEFIAAGHRIHFYDSLYNELHAWAIKFTPSGEIIWNISDTILSDRLNGVTHFTSGLEISPTGQIYLAGYVLNDQPTSDILGWLVKITPDGCMDTICITTSIPDQNNYKNDTVIFPNPSCNLLNLRLLKLKDNAHLKIYDLMGHNTNTFYIDQKETQFETNLNSGIYFYIIYEGPKILKSGKLIISSCE